MVVLYRQLKVIKIINMNILELNQVLLLVQFLSFITGIMYFKKVNNSIWKWFILYLAIIFCNEFFYRTICEFLNISNTLYYFYYAIPIQFIFLYWLYSKILNKEYLFFIFVSLYILSLILYVIFTKEDKISCFNPYTYLFGSLLLFILVILEFLKQINSDEIIYFYRNKMFYINIGVFLFYVGTAPFYSFLKLFDVRIISLYSNFSYGLNCFMYLLFSASFIWGKQNSK